MSILAFFSGASGPAPLPPPPSRDLALGGQLTFQGLYVKTRQYGWLPLFQPIIGWLDYPEDRQACYDVLRAAGDTKVCLALSGQYREGDSRNLLEPVNGRDYSSDLPAFHALIEEVLAAGFASVEVMLSGDGQSYDPGGMTHGFAWLMANFARIYAGLEDLSPYIVWQAGFDGWIPGWDWDDDGGWVRVEQWLSFARSVIGSCGYLGVYLSAGYWCWTESDRYLSPAGREVDQVLVEFPCPMGPPTSEVPANFCGQDGDVRAPFDQVWQISSRVLGPLYRRPPEQPACDDGGVHPGIPPTGRGPVVVVAREFDTYLTARGISTDTAARRAYLHAIGWANVG